MEPLDIPIVESADKIEQPDRDGRPSLWEPDDYVDVAIHFLNSRFYDMRSAPSDHVYTSAGRYYPKKYVYEGLLRMATLEGGNPLHKAKRKQFLLAELIEDATDLPYKLAIIRDFAQHVPHKLKSYGGLRKWLIYRFTDHALDLQSKHLICDILMWIGYPMSTLVDIPEYLSLERVPLDFAKDMTNRFLETEAGKQLVESNCMLMYRLKWETN
jgi:hypothetical protein